MKQRKFQIGLLLVAFAIAMAVSSCSKKTCPAYSQAKSNSEQVHRA